MNVSSLKTPNVANTPREEDWFDNVENLRPLRGGRRAETLNEIASGALRTSAEDAEKKFREDFEAASQREDPLAVLWNFSNWFEEHFPSGKHRVFYPILYKVYLNTMNIFLFVLVLLITNKDLNSFKNILDLYYICSNGKIQK